MARFDDTAPLVPDGFAPARGPCARCGSAESPGGRWHALQDPRQREAAAFFAYHLHAPTKSAGDVSAPGAAFCAKPSCLHATFRAWWRGEGKAEFAGDDVRGAPNSYPSLWRGEDEQAQKELTYGRTAASVLHEYVPAPAEAAPPPLVVHVVGAAAREAGSFEAAEMLCGPLMDVARGRGHDTVRMAFVGPSLPEALHGQGFSTAWGVAVFSRRTYQDFLSDAPPMFLPPDLIFMFHPALFGHLSWREGVRKALAYDAVLAVTAYSMAEADEDLEALRDEAVAAGLTGARLLRPPAPNPWGCVRARAEAKQMGGVFMDDNLALTVVKGAGTALPEPEAIIEPDLRVKCPECDRIIQECTCAYMNVARERAAAWRRAGVEKRQAAEAARPKPPAKAENQRTRTKPGRGFKKGFLG